MTTRAQLQRWLLDDEARRLAGHFADLLLGELEAILFVVLAWWVTQTRARRSLMVVPFVVVFVLYTAYLPRLFGVLVYSTTYNRIVLRSEEPGATADCLYLLHKTPDEFVVWNATSRTVVWVPKARLHCAEVRQGRPLFKKTKGTPTRGIIIAAKPDERLRYALKKVPDTELYLYKVDFKLEKSQ
jgi:hypothetical protein